MLRAIKNERGDMNFFTAFFIVAINILIVMLFIYFSVQINVSNVRSSAKMELNNLSARIAADTFAAQREGNLDAYMNTLYQDHSYQAELEDMFISGFQDKTQMSTESYDIVNIELDFSEKTGRIEYEFTCEFQYYIRMFGDAYPVITESVELTGYHVTKY